jgi:hypothetical protein
MLGGGARFSQETISGQNSYQAEISVDAAYLLQFGSPDKSAGTLALGIRPSFSWDPTEAVYKGVVFARYYYNFKTVSPFVEINTGYRYKSSFDAINGEEFSYTESFVLGFKAGGAFYIAPHVTFDTFFFYDDLQSTIHFNDNLFPSSKTSDQSLGLGIGFQIFLQ